MTETVKETDTEEYREIHRGTIIETERYRERMRETEGEIERDREPDREAESKRDTISDSIPLVSMFDELSTLRCYMTNEL